MDLRAEKPFPFAKLNQFPTNVCKWDWPSKRYSVYEFIGDVEEEFKRKFEKRNVRNELSYFKIIRTLNFYCITKRISIFPKRKNKPKLTSNILLLELF